MDVGSKVGEHLAINQGFAIALRVDDGEVFRDHVDVEICRIGMFEIEDSRHFQRTTIGSGERKVLEFHHGVVNLDGVGSECQIYAIDIAIKMSFVEGEGTIDDGFFSRSHDR